MELVINISEEIAEELIRDAKESKCINMRYTRTLIDAIANGTPLPKGHGELIDIDKAFDEYDRTAKTMISVVTDAEVLVKADKGDRE